MGDLISRKAVEKIIGLEELGVVLA